MGTIQQNIYACICLTTTLNRDEIYDLKSNWTVRPNPEGQINRKPEDQKLTRGPNN